MTTLQKKIQGAIRTRGIPQGSRLVLGVSGGADSMAMFDAIHRLEKFVVAAAHLNHCLRGAESDADEEFVESEARKRGVEYISERIDVASLARERKRNVEATARTARYEFLTRSALSLEAPYVLTAHTRDDQVETILLRLIRGTSPSGMRGIYASRPLGRGITLHRTMLEVARPEVLEHLTNFKIDYRTDSTNLSSEYARNRVRNEVIPLLRQFNPEFDEAAVRLAEMISEDALMLDEQARNSLKVMEQSLDARHISTLSAALRRRIVKAWIEDARGHLLRIDKSHLDAIDDLIARRRGNKTIELPEGWRVRLKDGHLTIFQASTVQEVYSTKVERGS